MAGNRIYAVYATRSCLLYTFFLQNSKAFFNKKAFLRLKEYAQISL